MTYEQFKDLPIPVLRQLEILLVIKVQFGMEFTSFEEELHDHFGQFNDEVTSKLRRNYLEACLSK
jgi:hypothetical protein